MNLTQTQSKPILVTGATGYIGARLVPRLLEAGYRVRVLVRDPARLNGRPWAGEVEICTGDVLKPETLPAALAGTRAAFYLIHSMTGHADFHDRDVVAARNFGAAAGEAGVEQVIYLSGLGQDSDEGLSAHLSSRHATGDALRESGVPVTELRAAVIVGSGSLSFEMIRNLTERLPIMIVPKWASTRIQPVGIREVLSYLIATLEAPACAGRIIEIGGADVLTYADMMTQYAEERELRRWLIHVPVLTPRLSSYWVHWVTPVPASIAKPLIEGLRNEVIVRDESARSLFPEIVPTDYRTSVQRALERIREGDLESIWSDALSSSQGDERPSFFRLEQGMFIERREILVEAPAFEVYRAFTRLGGGQGWPTFGWAWQARGVLDRLVGGVGMRRGRRDPVDLRVGDALDFWRVEEVESGHLLRLRAEMKVPGRAWLQFEVDPAEEGRSRLIQTAYFASKGLGGLLYWYALYPVHGLIFGQMPKQIAAMAEKGMPSI
ncbi:MAG: SDR family oxidoreductase [Chloroflexota bacterium]